MIPLKDNLKYLGLAWVSVAIFAINVLLFVGELTFQANGDMMTVLSSWLPSRAGVEAALSSGDPSLMLHAVSGVFVYMFLHGSFMHIFGNMCFFFTFAPALEARMGHVRFAAFYLVSGLVAVAVQLLTVSPGWSLLVGASGAIGGVLGAYVIYFPRARVNGWNPPFGLFTGLGVFFLSEFLLMQWFSIWSQLHGAPAEAAGEAANVGYWAHIGGITFGMAVAALMALSDAGRLRLRYVAFYTGSALAVAAAFILPGHTGVSPFWFAVGAAGSTTSVYVALFVQRLRWWWKSLATPLITLAACFLLGACVNEALVSWQIDPELPKMFAVGLTTVTIMLLSIVVAVAARRLPVQAKPIVIVPKPKAEERIIAEVAVDLIVGFFGFLSAVWCRAMALAAAMFRFGYDWSSKYMSQGVALFRSSGD